MQTFLVVMIEVSTQAYAPSPLHYKILRYLYSIALGTAVSSSSNHSQGSVPTPHAPHA